MNNIQKYGLLTGVIYVITLISGIIIQPEYGKEMIIPFYISTFFLLVFLTIAIYKESQRQDQPFDFIVGIKTGLGISALAGLIYSVAIYVIYKWIYSNWKVEETKKYYNFFHEQDPGASSSDVLQKAQNAIASFPFKISLISVARVLFIGAFIALAVSLIVQLINAQRKKAH